ncbi:SaV-like [uncultured Caudovirales phage]|jgi:hypothetical protein|uniref:SaV-like n=1 Tax=uncultured Caudovirales phage TaxID=2100421 RepID=A0A6J5NR40_9CAUD|nr:SaV-like [uncultured Caudovirales phage]
MDNNPIAMPAHYGYEVLTEYEAGMEDSGDVLARQVGGDHYKRAHQPWEIIEEWGLDYWAGNVVKYVLRYKFKNGVEDLEKARHYLDYLIKKEKDAITAARN